MNRFLVLIVTLLISISSFSQAEPGVATLGFGDMGHFDDVSVEFLELISDSRCPKMVNCIRAGEAKVLVAIYVGGKFTEERTLIFHANGLVNTSEMQLFNSNDLNIQGLSLAPYPQGLNKIVDEDYYLDLRIN